MTNPPSGPMTAREFVKDFISKWNEIKFIRQNKIITAMNAFAAQAREESSEQWHKAGYEDGYKFGFEQAREMAIEHADRLTNSYHVGTNEYKKALTVSNELLARLEAAEYFIEYMTYLGEYDATDEAEKRYVSWLKTKGK